jgi:hypothetical protein
MSYRNQILTSALILCLLSLPICQAQSALSLSGRILTKDTKGSSRFNIKLYPPKKSNRAILLTSADYSGNFKFTNLAASSYLLEVYVGTKLVYQQVITLDRNKEISVDLRSTKR